ncbi:hypothetical protein [Aquimarina litoralis]|nr:hypothetical protein [Aquimarina litoralis]
MKSILDIIPVQKLNKQQQQQITGGLAGVPHAPCGGPDNNTSFGYCEP